MPFAFLQNVCGRLPVSIPVAAICAGVAAICVHWFASSVVSAPATPTGLCQSTVVICLEWQEPATLYHFQLRVHCLHVAMGHCLRMAAVTHVCLLLLSMHVGNERRYVFQCPSFDLICTCHSRQFDDSHGTMRPFMWLPHQKECFAFRLPAALPVSIWLSWLQISFPFAL